MSNNIKRHGSIMQDVTEHAVSPPDLVDRITVRHGSKTQDVGKGSVDTRVNAQWERLQRGGNRTDYLSAFAGPTWDWENFLPMYDICPKEADMMFFWFNMPMHPYPEEIPEPIDLVEQLKRCSVELDFSNCEQFWRAFSYAYISHVGVIDFKKCQRILTSYDWQNDKYFDDGLEHEMLPTKWAGMFHGSYIHTIDKLIFYYTNPSFDDKWLPEDLENVTCEGTILSSGLNFTNCKKITRESIMSFFNVLADFTTDKWKDYKGSTGIDGVVTLGADNRAKLSDEDIAVATNKGWTVL